MHLGLPSTAPMKCWTNNGYFNWRLSILPMNFAKYKLHDERKLSPFFSRILCSHEFLYALPIWGSIDQLKPVRFLLDSEQAGVTIRTNTLKVGEILEKSDSISSIKDLISHK